MVWLEKVVTEFGRDLQRWMSASGLWYIAAGKCDGPKAVGLLFSGTFDVEIQVSCSSWASFFRLGSFDVKGHGILFK